ncbi:SNF2 family N-terminal domain-containing protein [Gilbertella persicaria]|uniref:SNF2 family N-terminal domain-containing protein n=1 Tax=Gilbertella persicaria TaxID=101096 RepID=UPI00221F4451|nr:SNF2 family N-terminal domain-containing protein [Gilbertella persicaria]KAI8079654.1 SNF2 family N-terminal domain-containing protein [Gilbertella persicaria]
MSPLVSIHWFRCILDEAQMIEANVSRVAAVAKCIPAWYRWAVTGTPLKNDLSQLYGLYDFLGLEKSIHSPQQFQKLCKDPEYKSVFYEFARATMRRNMKAALHNQVHIPKQHRHVVRIPFGTIEQHYYEDLWRACQSQLKLEWLDSINWTLSDTASEEQINEFNASRQKMRLWLLALRQGCIHPSMISNTTLGLGNQQPGNTSKKTHSLDNVLQYMSKSAEDRLDTEQHAYYSMQLKRGGMHEVLKQWQEAVDVYTKHILDVEKQVETYLQGKSSTEEQEKNAAQHLYKWQILLHRYYFYTAGVYHMLESKDLEEACYDKASQLRQLIMDSYTTRVNESTLEMDKAAARVQLTPEYRLGPRVIDTSFIDQLEYEDEIKDNEEEEEEEDLFAMKGQRAADKNILENVKQLGFILDEQLKKIMYLRKKILPILRKPLVDSNNEETEVTGDEYEESLNEQEMCQVYLAAYQALLQDRKFIIKGTIATSSDIEPVGSESSMSEVCSIHRHRKITNDFHRKQKMSRELKRYSESKLENLALKWSISKMLSTL